MEERQRQRARHVESKMHEKLRQLQQYQLDSITFRRLRPSIRQFLVHFANKTCSGCLSVNSVHHYLLPTDFNRFLLDTKLHKMSIERMASSTLLYLYILCESIRDTVFFGH